MMLTFIGVCIMLFGFDLMLIFHSLGNIGILYTRKVFFARCIIGAGINLILIAPFIEMLFR